jgi:hypothetical protein
MKSLAALAMLVIGIGGLTACGPARALRDDEATIAAWYVEDLAHGNPRDPGEIALVEHSEAMARLEPLLGGSTMADGNQPLQPVAARRERWATLRGLFRSGAAVTVVTGPNQGLVAPAGTLSGADLTMATAVIDAENNDRRTLDALIITASDLANGHERVYLDPVRQARRDLDLAGGATIWPPPTAQTR